MPVNASAQGDDNVQGCRCDLCPLRVDRQHKRPIDDEIHPGAAVLFIGEAPGKHELEAMRPFVGASGEELHKYLRQAHLTRSDVDIANVLLCRPPADLDDYLKDVADRNIDRAKANKERGRREVDPGYSPPLADPRDCCRPRLMRYLPDKRVIIPLGGTALEAVTGLDKISFWRGSPLRVEQFADPPWGYEGAVGSPLPVRQPPHPVRGDVRETRAEDEVWVVPSLHPAYTLHEGPGRVMRGVVAHDVRKALRVLKDDRISWTEPNLTLTPTSPQAVEEALAEAAAYSLAHETAVAVDIETDPHTPRRQTAMWMVGFSWGDAGTFIIPFRAVSGSTWWPDAYQERIYEALRALLLHEGVKKVFHNHTFDVPILERHLKIGPTHTPAVGAEITAAEVERRRPGVTNIADTMVAHHAVCSELSHSLAFVATLYTDARFWKDTVKDGGKWNPSSDEVFALYCARDCLTTWRIWEGALRLDLRGQLPGAKSPVDATEVYEHGMQVAKKVLMPLHENGMRFDLEKAQEVRKVLVVREAECRDRMQVLLEPTDYASRMLERAKLAKAKDTQIRYENEAVHFHPGGVWGIRCALEAMKVPIQERTATGLLATGQEILAKAAPYASSNGRDFVRLLIGTAEGKAGNVTAMGWRACVKLRTTYLENPSLDTDGRLHADWRMLTHTGRLASSPNCQNFPAFMRSVIVPERGCVLVSTDFARVEWHAQALMSGDKALLKLFEEEDPHDVNAKLIFGERYITAEKDVKKRLRRLAKSFVYGLGYGATDMTIWENLVTEWPELKPADVRAVSKRMKALYPMWFRWRDDLLDHTRMCGYLRSAIMGRVRYFLGGLEATEVLNNKAQACVPATARIHTDRGFVPISALADGLHPGALAWTGRRYAPFSVLRMGDAEVYEVTLANGLVFLCDARHALLTVGVDDYEWVEAHALRAGARVCLSVAIPHDVGGVVDAETAYWFGRYLGDGHFSLIVGDHDRTRYAVTIAFDKRDASAMERCRMFFSAHGVTASPYVSGTTNQASVDAVGKDLARWWSDLGAVPNENAHTKRVPRQVFAYSLAARKAYLRGYWDADGSHAAPREPKARCCQRPLLHDLLCLARTVGCEAWIQGPYRADEHGHVAWELRFVAAQLDGQLQRGPGGRLRMDARAPEFEIKRFVAEPRHGPAPRGVPRAYRTATQSTLVCRMRRGGSVGLYTLRALFGVDLPYYPVEVLSVQPTGRVEPVFTLSVDDSEHRYEADGVISRNCAADAANIAAIRLYDAFTPTPEVRLVNQSHDSLTYECPEERAEWVAETIKAIMPGPYHVRFNVPGYPNDMDVFFGVDVKAGTDWSQV